MKLRTLAVALALGAVALAGTSASAATGGKLFIFRGELVNATTTSVQLTVEGGNRPGLRKMLGQSQQQTFGVGSDTRFVIWRDGIPHLGSATDLKQGDWVAVRVRATPGSSLSQVEGTPANVVTDSLSRPAASHPLYLFAGTVSGPQSGGHIGLHVTGGNRLALRHMLGVSPDQTFTYDDSTFFLLWKAGVPTVIDASQLKAGDRITVRVRAPRRDTLAQVEATPAVRVGDHEPA
jgi:hypothetical protein